MTDADLSARHDALLTLIASAGASAPRRRLLETHGTPEAALAGGVATGARTAWTQRRSPRCAAPTAARSHAAAAGSPTPTTTCSAGTTPTTRRCCDAARTRRWRCSSPATPPACGTPRWPWSAAARRARAGATTRPRSRAPWRGSGLAVTSGLAAGIDTAAHLATLAVEGLTIAVLGTGPDIAYPAGNRALHARIATHGALVSEHLPGTGPKPGHFPRRNRILAGLSLGTVVIEAAARSGALITARLAAEAGREVFALPGSIHNPLSRGCHRLIRDGAGAGRIGRRSDGGAGAAGDRTGRRLATAPERPHLSQPRD